MPGLEKPDISKFIAREIQLSRTQILGRGKADHLISDEMAQSADKHERFREMVEQLSDLTKECSFISPEHFLIDSDYSKFMHLWRLSNHYRVLIPALVEISGISQEELKVIEQAIVRADSEVKRLAKDFKRIESTALRLVSDIANSLIKSNILSTTEIENLRDQGSLFKHISHLKGGHWCLECTLENHHGIFTWRTKERNVLNKATKQLETTNDLIEEFIRQKLEPLRQDLLARQVNPHDLIPRIAETMNCSPKKF